MALLDEAKLALRIGAATTAYDAEVEGLIAAAQADLIDSGVAEDVAKASSLAPAVKQAVMVYCKAHFGYDNAEADRLKQIYEQMAQKLSLIAEYNGGVTDGTVA